jgi:hypothetical protein
MRIVTAIGLALSLTACGGGPAAEPVLEAATTGSYDGTEFTVVSGFASADADSALILLGDGNLYCGVESSGSPPTGRNASISLPALEVGSYGSVMVFMMEDVGSYRGSGANTGSVTLTEVTETSVAGEVSFSHTNDQGQDFSLSGTFEVARCAE